MMKIYRSSGSPITPEHNEAYYTALDAAMTALEMELGKCTQENAKEFQGRMETIHRGLTKDYPNSASIAYPSTKKSLSRLLKVYGTVAFCEEEDEIVAYIMDT